MDRNANKGSRVRERSLTNNASAVGVNDFNIHKIEDRHNPMVNPLPYNIQNPYLLKEMMRKHEIMNHNWYFLRLPFIKSTPNSNVKKLLNKKPISWWLSMNKYIKKMLV